MAVIEREVSSMFANKDAVRQLVAEVNERMGFVPDPTAATEKVRLMMRLDGIELEDNAFTSELLRMRYEED